MRPSHGLSRTLARRQERRFRLALGLGSMLGTAFGLVVGIVATLLVTQDDIGELPKGELVILSGQDQSLGGQRKALVENWNTMHPDNKATIIELPSDADAAHAEMVARAQSGDREVDIFNLDVTWIAEFADAGHIRALDEDTLDLDGFLRKPLDTCRYDGRLWALPFNTDAGLLYYRNDQVPAPTSWADLRANVQEYFAGSGADPAVVAGYAGQLAPYEGLTVNVVEAIQDAAGDRPIVRDNRMDVGLDVIDEGIRRLRVSGDAQSIVLPASLDHGEVESTQAFRDGKVVYLRNWPVAYRSLDPSTAGEAPRQEVPFDVTTLPGSAVLGGQNLALAESSDNPVAAQQLIEFLTDSRSQQLLFERGGLAATRAAVYHDEVVKTRHPYAGVLLDAIDNAHPRPVTPCYFRFSEVLRTAAEQLLRHDTPLPDDFVDQLNAALRTCSR